MALTSLGLACMLLSQEANQLQVLFPAQECIAYIVLVRNLVDAHYAGGAVW